MGFDAAGNFSRAYNYTQDRDNGIKILASHVDGEFDNFATAMNLVFFRDGRVPMSADLRLNINGIQGLKDGALGSPAIKFNTDANTGPYLDGLSRYAIGVNAVQRGVFTTTGFDVTGVLSQGGAAVATQAWVSGAYAPLASPAFTGVPTAPTAAAGTSTTQLATTAFVQGGYLPLTGGALSGNINVNGGTATVGTDGGAGSSLTLKGGTATSRGVFFSGAGAYVGDISLQTDNSTVKYNITGGAHQFTVTGTEYARINAGGISAPQLNITGATGAVTLAPRDGSGGTAIIYSPTNKSISLNDGAGSDIVAFTGAGVAILSKSGGYYSATGAGNATYGGTGFSHTHVGQVGYHMYNGGGVAEWVMYQPAGGTGSEFRIGQFAGAMTDRFKISTAGDTYVLGNTSVKSELWVGQNDSTGVVRFGNAGSASTKYLWYDGTQFQLSAALVVGGNISSSSDARLKSNIRPLGDARAIIAALQGVRFDMYGKADLGLIAQDVQRSVPEVVSADKNGMLAVDYGRLVSVLINDNNALAARLARAGL